MEALRPSSIRREKKLALLQDVDRLKKKLRHEENVHRALERAFTRPLGTLPRLPPYLPPYTLELLAEVAVLEEEVVRLEEQVVHFRKGLYLEAVNISTSKNSVENTNNSSHLCMLKSIGKVEPIQAETNCISSSNPQTDDRREKENQTCNSSIGNKSNSPKKKPFMVKTSTMTIPFEMKTSEKGLDVKKLQLDCRYDSQDNVEAISPSLRDESPNAIAENILRCLLRIFSRITTSKNRLSAENLPVCVPWPFLEDGHIELEDPYDVWPRFGKRDIGPYKILVKKLASVKLQRLTHQEKLAIWINVYNSCMMNVYLEHGIPDDLQKLVELMQKATINVGGHMLNAITIEHFILRLPYHSNVRTYTASEVENELEVAKREYLQAAISISSNKLIIPKKLDWYMHDFAKDLESLLDWICLQLPTTLRKDVMKSLERAKNEPLSQIVGIMPYNFSFRYLLHG